jgi:hypothetical protein
MTMLMHGRGPMDRVHSPSSRRDAAGPEARRARLAKVKQFCISALAVVATGGFLVAIMALKIIAYLPRFHYH